MSYACGAPALIEIVTEIDAAVVDVEWLREDLTEYTADVFSSLTRSGWQDRAGWYLDGLMLDGRRKSIQPMAARLGGMVHEQVLNHFVTNSPWPVEPVRARIAELVDEVVGLVAWGNRRRRAAQVRHLGRSTGSARWDGPALTGRS